MELLFKKMNVDEITSKFENLLIKKIITDANGKIDKKKSSGVFVVVKNLK